jgi:hypothetical protein
MAQSPTEITQSEQGWPGPNQNVGANLWQAENRGEGRDAAGSASPRSAEGVVGEFLEVEGDRYYCITNYDRLEPFLMSVVSASDHWLYLSSTGGLTAGRENPDCALFPYANVDHVHDSAGTTGGETAVLVQQAERLALWQPLRWRRDETWRLTRRLYKNLCGTVVIFEEDNDDLGLRFRARWTTSEGYGFVRHCSLENEGTNPCHIRLLDGLHNVVPAGVTQQLQRELSTLTDAYKRHELDRATGLALYTLAAQITDRAVPQEQLRATTVWHTGLPGGGGKVVLDPAEANRFYGGDSPEPQDELRGRRGHYHLFGTFPLNGDQRRDWALVAEVQQSQAEVARLREELLAGRLTLATLTEDREDNRQRLWQLVAQADGLQLAARDEDNAHHFASVLFNIMRGGIFWQANRLKVEDFLEFVARRNRPVWQKQRALLEGYGERIEPDQLWSLAQHSGQRDFQRLVLEYLPLTFSRRHGDPSRPWNRFDIRVKDERGGQLLAYEGNWRDIFQNWEALARSFPQYLPHMIAKFVNASTVDGHNPYRITDEGIDWERPEPDSPWSNIGYWGDHQVIYLLKLMEWQERHEPGLLLDLMKKPIFSYAHVPYRIADFDAMRHNPRGTIAFDRELDGAIGRREVNLGTDGRLLLDQEGRVVHVNLAEKLLVMTLAKLSSLVPQGGIWLNTQRPEWNDANNALVGYGLSVVTVCHLRRFLCFWRDLLPQEPGGVTVSREVAQWLKTVSAVLQKAGQRLRQGPAELSAAERGAVVEGLCRGADDYRRQVYGEGFGGLAEVTWQEMGQLVESALVVVEQTIRHNRRSDGLYHSYNLLHLDGPQAFEVRHLYEMLEGQVAVLSSGMLSPQEVVHLLRALANSGLYRPDHQSYLLYPDRNLPRFLEKNSISPTEVAASPLVQRLLADEAQELVLRDASGTYRFHADLTNGSHVAARLDALRQQESYADITDDEAQGVLGLYEQVFQHQRFTGRSGTMFAFEGLGSIYWHMVSKLLLAVQENVHWARDEKADERTINELAAHYGAVRQGLGFNMPPDVYGAFPADPYSHSPARSGARQPGMTGQVKEDILARLGELGVHVEGGSLCFRPHLLTPESFLPDATSFEYCDVGGRVHSMALPAQSLAFTLCQVPVVYRRRAGTPSVRVYCTDGEERLFAGSCLDEETTRLVFNRGGGIASIEVTLAS